MKSCVESVILPPHYIPHCLVAMGFHAIGSLRPALKRATLHLERDRQCATLHLSDAHVHHAGRMSLLLLRPVRSSLLNHSRPHAICPRTVETSPSLYRGSVRARVICKLVRDTPSSQAPLMHLNLNGHQDGPRFGLLCCCSWVITKGAMVCHAHLHKADSRCRDDTQSSHRKKAPDNTPLHHLRMHLSESILRHLISVEHVNTSLWHMGA